MKKLGIALAVVVGILFVLYLYGSTPEAKQQSTERMAIELCWKEQGRKSNDPGTARFVAGACERMEQDFKNKWRSNP